MTTFTGVLGSEHSLLGRIQLAHVPSSVVDEGRAWTYDNTDVATYGGTAVFGYGRTPDWTYTPVTG